MPIAETRAIKNAHAASVATSMPGLQRLARSASAPARRADAPEAGRAASLPVSRQPADGGPACAPICPRRALTWRAKWEKGSLVLSSDQGHLMDGHFEVDQMLRACRRRCAAGAERRISGPVGDGRHDGNSVPGRKFPSCSTMKASSKTCSVVSPPFPASASITRTRCRPMPRGRVFSPIRRSSSMKPCRA